MDTEDITALRAELDRVSAELQETTEEKFQAAQYGLAVLEENAELKQKSCDLETECDALKLELKQMKEALAEAYSNQKRTAADGESREESLLKETASREAKFTGKIDELQNELRQMKSFITNTSADNERLTLAVQNLKKECHDTEKDKVQLREEMKQCKIREMRQLQDLSELEEENISLLKQVSVLKENQVDYEGIKHELKRRDEEIDVLHGQLDELVRLKDIAEHQLEEALESLKSEREQKSELRRELSSYLSYDSIGNLHTHFEDQNEEEFDSGYNSGGLNKSNGDILMSTPRNSDIFHPGPKLASDLFTELSLTEIQKLKQQLLQVDREKANMEINVQEIRRNLDAISKDLRNEQQRNAELVEQMKTLQKNGNSRPHFGSGDEMSQCTCGQEGAEVSRLEKELKDIKQRYEMFERRYQEEKQEWEMNKQVVVEELHTSVKLENDDRGLLSVLQEELRTARRLYCDFQCKLNLAQDELLSFIEELAHLYNHVCMRNNLTPDRVMLDYYRDGKGAKLHFRKRKSSDFFGKLLVNPDLDMSDLHSGEHSPLSSPDSSIGSDFGDSTREPLSITHLIAVVKDQIKHLQGALSVSWHHTSLETITSEMDKEKEVLVEEVMKLKALLSTKREQIATLRTVLKANKQTAEVAMSNLKSKYENEKALISETMLKLRRELKALKEDAATFSSMRSVFASRCDQYVNQLEDMQRQLVVAEDEKKTLNALLRMAIQQKLALTQRLEGREAAQETSKSSRTKSVTKAKTRSSKSKVN
ncbi:protein bicaudal D homolog 2-like [Hyla sarda]|uniref:protein bicaudal D homolog 2-like n=1 Tax=Hyla sarda TaxID=327740 RepID=UPI0024C26F8F|nr:protein bicaudal D homolog 2-like [Hyla sarda]XP_056395987.1 protein bicaudal D homolog 2-like [Hyla sarda]